ncbi:MAG: oligosaccharide flippase family protein [Rhodobacteraceae bacterium]|nr:oligosaccharide flippase family protein [Paracoccaceae bacterium]
MRDARRSYLSGAAVVWAARMASFASGFASLLLLTRILSQATFGAYSFAMNVVLLLGLLAVLGLDRALLYRVAATAPAPGVLKGTGLVLRVTAAGVGFAGVVAILLWAFAPQIEAAGAPLGAAFWLAALAAAVVPLALTRILASWMQANHRVAIGIIVPAISDAARAGLLGLVYLFGGGQASVAGAVVAAAIVPAVILVVTALRLKRRRAPRRMMLEDLSKGSLFLTQRIANEGIRRLDLILLGFASTGAEVAVYAVASRLGELTEFGRVAFKPTFVPRARRHLARGDDDSAQREFRDAQLAATMIALGAAAGFALLGLPILTAFGDYSGAYATLLIISAGYVALTGCGMPASYLAMSGEVFLSAALRVAALVIASVLILLLAPTYGAVGCAVAIFVARTLVGIASLAVLWRVTGFCGLRLSGGAGLTASVALLLAGGFGVLPGWLVSAGLVLHLVLLVALEPRVLVIARKVLAK